MKKSLPPEGPPGSSRPGAGRQTLKVNDAVGAGKDVSMVVDSTVPVLAERPMYFDYQGWTGGHDTMGL